MTWFVVIAVAMGAIALAWVLPGLLRSRDAGSTVQLRASNLAILRDQLRELAEDLAAGTLSAQQYLQAREDLERRALEEEPDGAAPAASAPARARLTALALAISIPLCAAGLYWQFGTPAAMLPSSEDVHKAGKVMPQDVEAMVKKLVARLEQKPDDGDGWVLLARSYTFMKRHADAVAAYEHAVAISPDNADLLADYADALAVGQGRRIEGKPLQIVERALKIDPMQWKALAMAGTAAFDRKDYQQAIGYWGKLQSRAEPGSEFARQVAASIAEARQLDGTKVQAKPNAAPLGPAAQTKPQSQRVGAGVDGIVTLSWELASKAAPTDTVFVFAHAAKGPRMPLAILRFHVKDLPANFHFDDSLAMSPEMKLSNHPDVVIGARVSKTAGAEPQAGDLQGFSKQVKVGAAGVVVVISQVVPDRSNQRVNATHHKMRTTCLIFLACLYGAIAPACAKTSGEVDVGGTLREATMIGLSGPSRRLSEFRGKPLIINVWASWCDPCRKEMGSLDRLSRRYGGRQFNVIGISTDDYRDAAGAFLREINTSFSHFIDNQLYLENMLGADKIPLTLLIDAQGRVLGKYYGAKEWDSREAKQVIAKTFRISM